MSDIVERLRAMNPWTDMDWPEVKNEAAEEITALRARIDKLEKALEPFASEAECYDPDTGDGDDTVWALPAYFKIRDLRAARAALTEAKG